MRLSGKLVQGMAVLNTRTRSVGSFVRYVCPRGEKGTFRKEHHFSMEVSVFSHMTSLPPEHRPWQNRRQRTAQVWVHQFWELRDCQVFPCKAQ